MAKPQIEALLKTGRSYYYTGGGEGFLIIRTRQRFLCNEIILSSFVLKRNEMCSIDYISSQKSNYIVMKKLISSHRTRFIFRGLDLSRPKNLNSYQMVHCGSFVNSLNNLRTPLLWNLVDIHGAQWINLKIFRELLTFEGAVSFNWSILRIKSFKSNDKLLIRTFGTF